MTLLTIMNWHELTSLEIGALDRELPVVVPLGSCERHEKYLPVYVYAIQMHCLTDLLNAASGGRAAILPPLWLGASHHHSIFLEPNCASAHFLDDRNRDGALPVAPRIPPFVFPPRSRGETSAPPLRRSAN